ncbi:MAG: 3-hydroxyacyl-CoA dehydrogenase NAD-binding domain-containing protein [Bacteroidia bacterium]|jgi:3-hydroxybutyryl-CoA dehydrogenase|nr:3-hydroxyacyl-CoA dehydrogenase NAD-binding domain-containing protein [Bacteroidia bacterium]GIV23175.1 MAG: hypothetical protein KatS3mg025_0834 [Bacteroidia bacterium]
MENVWILGAGTMGRGIAEVFASQGFLVTVIEPLTEARTRAEAFFAEKRLSVEIAGEMPSDALPAYVIEAVPEDIALKRAVLSQLTDRITAQTIVATNTSALSVHALARELPYRGQFLGWHFFNPAPRMPLVEVIPTAFSREEVVQKSLCVLSTVGKTPIMAPDMPGFIVNRVARPYYVEALRLAERGDIQPEGIDKLMEGLGFRMGPFRLMDFIGIDVNHAVTQAVWQGLWQVPRFRPSWLQTQKVAAGHTGRKAGKGFYEYP